MVQAEFFVSTANAETEEEFTSLYKRCFPAVARFVSNRKGSLQDAKDIFQDSLVVFYEKRQSGRLIVSLSNEMYIIGIAKHLWVRRYKEEVTKVQFTDHESLITVADHFLESTENDKLFPFLEKFGERCLSLLSAFYYDGLGIAQIKKAFGYTSDHSATVQKFKCLEKIRDHVKKQSIRYEDLA